MYSLEYYICTRRWQHDLLYFEPVLCFAVLTNFPRYVISSLKRYKIFKIAILKNMSSFSGLIVAYNSKFSLRIKLNTKTCFNSTQSLSVLYISYQYCLFGFPYKSLGVTMTRFVSQHVLLMRTCDDIGRGRKCEAAGRVTPGLETPLLITSVVLVFSIMQ